MAQVLLQPIETVDRPSHYRTEMPLPAGCLKEIVETTVAKVFGVDISHLRAESRGQAQVALARQVAMYLLHCAFSISLTDIGHIFCRDRTTVSHACKIIEDRRDEATFDYILNNLENIVRHRAKISIQPAVS
jgi:chromosomal replication initiation ATPase DnaA